MMDIGSELQEAHIQTYILPLPNLDSFVPTARSDWTGSKAIQLLARQLDIFQEVYMNQIIHAPEPNLRVYPIS